MRKNSKKIKDIGYGVKVKALKDMGVHNEEFDLMNELFLYDDCGYINTDNYQILNENTENKA